jgi:hypothetical protein
MAVTAVRPSTFAGKLRPVVAPPTGPRIQLVVNTQARARNTALLESGGVGVDASEGSVERLRSRP